MDKLVSVIILNYNNYMYTIDCLKSLTQQTYKSFEVILVDNGSNYNLFLELKQQLNQFNDVLDLRLVRNKVNLYFVSGSNKAIRLAKGEYICLLNYDVIASPDFFEKMVEFLDSHPEAGMISPKIKIFNDKKILWNTGAYLNFRSAIVIGNRGYLEYDPKDQKYNDIETIGFAPGTAVFVRQKVIDEIGLMDEIFFMYHEDPDWNLRAQIKGYKSYYVPTTTVYHNVPRIINEKRMLFNHHFFTRNSQILVWKHAKFIDILIFYYIFGILNLGIIFLNIVTKKFRSIIIRLNSIKQGFRIGLKRRTNRPCKKNIVSDYKFIKKIQTF
ncbi:MAG: glycosyltransferase family 2 protein [Candidatus Hermodarchaeota archaeon]